MTDTLIHKVLTLPPESPCITTMNNYGFALSFYARIINPLGRRSDSFIIPLSWAAVKGTAGRCKFYFSKTAVNTETIKKKHPVDSGFQIMTLRHMLVKGGRLGLIQLLCRAHSYANAI